MNPRGNIGSPRTLIRPLNQLNQLRIPDRPGGGFLSHPVIKPGTRDPHNLARHRDRKALGSHFIDEPESYLGRIFSLAKYAEARFRISFSISNTRVFRRSSMSSCFSALVSPSTRPVSTASIAIHRRRVPSLIPKPFTTWATGSPSRPGPKPYAGTPAVSQLESQTSFLASNASKLRCPSNRVKPQLSPKPASVPLRMTGVKQTNRSFDKNKFAKDLSHLVPGISAEDLVRVESGVRAQAKNTNGYLLDDFVFEHHGGQLNVLNAPSPAATASLAIADCVVPKALGLGSTSKGPWFLNT